MGSIAGYILNSQVLLRLKYCFLVKGAEYQQEQQHCWKNGQSGFFYKHRGYLRTAIFLHNFGHKAFVRKKIPDGRRQMLEGRHPAYIFSAVRRH